LLQDEAKELTIEWAHRQAHTPRFFEGINGIFPDKRRWRTIKTNARNALKRLNYKNQPGS
ncbi:hypothetical protein KGQ71_03620, partial [Patescibacteria group bacterium]|nr:hypothetical protein [Patescibacteria group bacterium]